MNQNYLNDMINYQKYMIPAVEEENKTFEVAKDGFLKGNMQKGTYIPYKKYMYYNPVILSEKDKMLYSIQEACFGAHEANLYLDTHPNDLEMIKTFKQYNDLANDLTIEYENKYGPICLSDNLGIKNDFWNWINNPWPWDN